MTAHTARVALLRTVPVLLGLAAVAIDWRLALFRSRHLLEHDESISLLMAAGKAEKMDRLYGARDRVVSYRADEIQGWLRPGAHGRAPDVVRSVAKHDIHPPLYFLLLHVLQRLGISTQAYLRMFGVAMVLVAAYIANRHVWPGAPPLARWLATWLLIASPVSLEIATELRQYSLVILGLVTAQAAMIAHWDAKRCERTIVALLAAAPVVLLWSQLGTAFWILTAFPIVALPCLRKRPGASRRLGIAVAAAAIPLAVLAIWWMTQAVGPNPIPPVSAARFYERGIEHMLCNVGRSLFSLPVSWQAGPVPTIVGGGVLIGLGVFAFAAKQGVERWIYCAALAWSLIWLALIAAEILPIHATHAEHLQVVILCIPLLLARAAFTVANVRLRRTATAVLALSAATHLIGIRNLFELRVERTAMAALDTADCVMATAPQRGHLLPVVAAVRPETAVVIGPPGKLSQEWPSRVPRDAERLVLLHVSVDEKEVDYVNLLSSLFDAYRNVRTAYEEYSWKLIAFRDRRTSAARP